MPDELVLPGIDPAPVAPAAPAPQDDTPTQSASVDTGAQAPTEDAPEEAPEVIAQKREAKGVQKRINELTAREREARADAQQARELLAQTVQGLLRNPQQQQPQRGPDAEAPPKVEDFADWREFNRAEARYIAQQQVVRAQALEQLHGITASQMSEAASRIPDYVDVIESCPVDIPDRLEAAMAISGAAGDVAYYIAKNPGLIRQLSNLPDMALAHQVGRIATAMRSNAATVSNAPSPGRPAGNRGMAPNDYPKDATPQQHLEWEARQKRASQRK
jgi:hypothetical protein